MPEPAFSCSVVPELGRTRIVLAGEIDIAAATAITMGAIEAVERGADVVVDLSAVSFLDGTGLSVLMSLAQLIADAGRSVTFAHRPPVVERILTLTSTTLERCACG